MKSAKKSPFDSGPRAVVRDVRLEVPSKARYSTAAAFLTVTLCVGLAGCTTSATPRLGAISVTAYPAPATPATAVPINSLAIHGQAGLSVSLGQNPENLQVIWSLTCQGSPIPVPNPAPSGYSNPDPNPCGTLLTSYGMSTVFTAPPLQPVGNTVTIEAALASDPSISSSVALPISPFPLAISISVPSTATLGAGGTSFLSAAVINDPNAAGVNWKLSCPADPNGGTACGSLQSGLAGHPTLTASSGQITYTAPSLVPPNGLVVTITATSVTDPAQSKSASVTISSISAHPPIAVTVAPLAASIQAGGTVPLTATVANDPVNAGVVWSCSPAGVCGSFSPAQSSSGKTSYTAPNVVPAGGSVTLTATSFSDNSKSQSATTAIVPAISVTFVPPTSVTAGIGIQLTATVTHDVAGAGVDWTASCNTPPCGTFNPAHSPGPAPTTTFTAPIGAPAGSITVTATSTASNAVPPLSTSSGTVQVVPTIAVSFVPYAPSQMQVSDSLNGIVTSAPISLTAAVTSDAANAGVDWSASGGEFQVTPAVAATSTTQAVNATYATTVHTANGQAAFYLPPIQPPLPGGTVTITAQAHNPAATSSLAKATATVKIVNTATGVQLNGVVMAGSHPVSGASVSLFSAGTTGYSSASSVTVIPGGAIQVISGANGQFIIPAGYMCPSQNSQMYVVAVGGNAGGGSNPNLAMMTALGACGSLSSGVNLTINEITTVGALWPLAPFMADYAHVGSSSSNAYTGLANAFAEINNLVDITTGQALATTPVGNGTVPQAEINTLADIINTCAVTAGGAVSDGSNCGNLFNATNLGILPADAPINTLQAALNIAQEPYYNTLVPLNGATVYSVLPQNGPFPFSPTLTAPPNDWTVTLTFAGGGLGGPSQARSQSNAMAIDASGNVWITNSHLNSVTELNNLGAPLSPAATGTTIASGGGYKGGGLKSPTALAIDPMGNAWVTNANGTLSTLSPTGSALSPSAGFSGGGLSSPIGVAIDGSGNVWAVNGGPSASVSWFSGANATINGVPTSIGVPLSPAAGFAQNISNPTGAIGIDRSGTVWVVNAGAGSNTGSVAELSGDTGSFLQLDFGYTQTVPILGGSVLSQGALGQGLAIDKSGNVFLPLGSNQIAELIAGTSANNGGLGVAPPATGTVYSSILALDGASNLWLFGNGNCIPYTASFVIELSSSGTGKNTSQACGYAGPGINTSDPAIAIDGSGNIWALSGSSVSQMIGVAAPVVTPFSLGIQNKTLGNKP